MAKSAFEKAVMRQGYYHKGQQRIFKNGWLASLRWVLQTKRGNRFGQAGDVAIDDNKIRDEIKKCEKNR